MPEAANAPSVTSRYLFLSPQVYGDNVVAFRLLRALGNQPDLHILGTDLTLEIAAVLQFDRFPIIHMPGGPSAIYDIKQSGVRRAVADFLTLRRALRASTTSTTLVLFGNQRRPGTHRLLQLTAGGFRYDEPRWGISAYRDRREMLERVFGENIDLPSCALPGNEVKTVLLAPGAREGSRYFPDDVVRNIIDYNEAHGRQTWLLDPTGHYATLRTRVRKYISRQPLSASVTLLKSADLCICTDSLFLHLSYYLGVPVVAMVPGTIARSFYFAPPGLLDHRLFLSFDAARHPQRLTDFLDHLPTRAAFMEERTG